MDTWKQNKNYVSRNKERRSARAERVNRGAMICRSDKRKDRVEIEPEQLTAATAEAEVRIVAGGGLPHSTAMLVSPM